MDDQDLFRRAMRSLGVDPLDKSETPEEKTPDPPESVKAVRSDRRRFPESFVPDEEDALFLESMGQLAAPPDKDRRSTRPKVEIRQVKASKRTTVEPEASLDLHGLTAHEALRKLQRFTAWASGQRMKAVLVVTGKGLRSERGVSVLKKAVEKWLLKEGLSWVRAFSEAPRSLGGSGAYLLYLR